MSRWTDEYKNHDFRTSWSELGTKIASIDLSEIAESDQVLELARLKKLYVYLDELFNAVDPEFFPLIHLVNIKNFTDECLSHVTQYASSRHLSHILPANDALDKVSIKLSQTLVPFSSPQKRALTQAITAYSDALNEHLEFFSNFAEEKKSEVDQKVSDIISDLEQKSTGNLSKLSELENQIKSAQGNIDKVSQTILEQTAQFQTQFNEDQRKRDELFNNLVEDYETRVEQKYGDFTKTADEMLESMSKHESDAVKILGVVVNTGQAGAYKTYAQEEGSTASWLRISAVVFMVLGIAFLLVPDLVTWAQTSEYRFDWTQTLARVPVSLIILIPAFYLARESSRHRDKEFNSKRRELILSTIDPYLTQLNEAEKDSEAYKLRTSIAQQIFRAEEANSVSEGNSKDLLSKYSEKLKS